VPETDTTKTSDEDRTSDEQQTSDDSTPEDKRSDDSASEDSAAQDSAPEDSADEDEDEDEGDVMSEPIDQGPALRDGGTLNLGICHFGGAEEPASLLASREDGTGWIAVCENHTKDAEEQGFVVEKKSSD
jgi:hypothetical protein